eukprot:Skav209754  [mRNA]  locus=scaffold9:126835:129075:+ [translate_table: standard]
MMIRNVPARCSQAEIEELLSFVTQDFRLQMPRSSERKCKGYAFIEGDAEVLRRLVHFLWQRQVPTRRSTRPLKIHPAQGFDCQLGGLAGRSAQRSDDNLLLKGVPWASPAVLT